MSLLSRSRRSPLVAAALLASVLVACDDPFEVRATVPVVEDTLVVNSISDVSAPPVSAIVIDIANQPALAAASRIPVARRLGGEFYQEGVGFDVAVDVRGDSVVFLPPRLVTTALSSVRRVGLRRDTIAFEDATIAPNRGYVFDTVSVSAREGDVVYVVSQHPVCINRNELNVELYAKIGVLDIDPVAKTATLRVRLDPNCGFRSFLPGIPGR